MKDGGQWKGHGPSINLKVFSISSQRLVFVFIVLTGNRNV